MNVIFLFPGQGSQTVGMGRDLAAAFPAAQRRFDEASHILGFDLATICFEGPEEKLRQTRVTQPALFVHSCILADLLAERNLRPTAAAGHSLGEYSALYVAGAFSFAEGLKLVRVRAEAMQRAGETTPGTMAALVGLEDDAVRTLCDDVRPYGIAVPANYNSPGQIVISGEVAAVRKAVELARSRGAKLARELPVSGAFHSPLMQPAAADLKEALAKATLEQPRIPVISNVTAEPHATVESLRQLLFEQLLSPVRWTQTLHRLASFGEAVWFEVGAGNVLAGLLKRTFPGALVHPVGGVEDLSKVTSLLSVGSV